MGQAVQQSRAVGDLGESIACEYLQKEGYRILDQNYRFRNGEIDLIARYGDFLVFVEVKTADLSQGNFHPFGPPETWLTRRKQLFLFRSAEYYLWKKGLSGSNCRFDLIAIRLFRDGPRIDHYPNAFWR